MTTNNGQRGIGNQQLVTAAPGLVLPKGFSAVDTSPLPKKLAINLGGFEKSGKSDWPLRTGIEPVFHFILDPNGIPTSRKIAKENPSRKLYSATYLFNRGEAQGSYKSIWDSFLESVYSALEQPVGTLVIDGGTDAWELARLAHFGKTEQVMELNYGPPNADMMSLYRAAASSNVSLVVTHKLSKEYVRLPGQNRGEWNGKYEFSQWKNTPYSVQANMEAYVDEAAFAGWNGKVGQKRADGTPQPWPFHIYIRDCLQNMTLKGRDYTTDFFTFPVMLNMVFGA